MRTSVERFRIGLLVGAALLVLVIAGFLGYARYRLHRAIGALPARLGATITKEFNGYTYSQSDGKKTIFTIHAAKAVQHTDGKYTLHDVNMVLYGHKGDRADRISGSDFEYDTKEEVVRAVGIVHLDLQAPTPAGEQTSDAAKHLGPAAIDTGHGDETPGTRVIHVKTSGLVYTKKLGIASTEQGIEFAFGGFTGHAVGAEFNSDTGHLVLESAITVSGLDRGRPVSLAASHGELDRSNNQAHFANARYNSAEEIAQADTANIHMRPDGSVERIEGERQILIEKAGQGKATADRATVTLDSASRPIAAELTGTVRFADDDPFRQARGESDRATLDFDNLGGLRHTVLSGHVRTNERSHVAETNAAWPERSLEAANLEMFLATEEGGKPQLRKAVATGSAHLSNVAVRAGKPGERPGTTTTKLAGDSLQANFASAEGTTQISTVHGTGHTVIDQLGPTGVHQTSAGETVDVTFREATGRKGSVEVATAVQEGGVIIDRTIPADHEKAADTQHATAQKAAYNADTNLLTLTGNVQMSDTGSALWADRVVVEQDSGNATADGSVKMTYAQSGSAEPVHILAARAELDHDAGRATFHGGSSDPHTNSKLARLWQSGSNGQGGSQIEAPVLVFEQEEKRLSARAEKPLTSGQVHAVLASTASVRPGATEADRDPTPKNFGKTPVRITSSQMVYSDLLHQAEFTGGVKVFDADGEMQAQTATAFLTSASNNANKSKGSEHSVDHSNSTGLLGGSVQRIVASQHVELTQPGRRATGDRLVYTAGDQMFVLTGTPTIPPRVVDALQGTTTGAALRFHSGGDSIAVIGSDGDATARRVRTETRVKQ